jgi:hypothetical protein
MSADSDPRLSPRTILVSVLCVVAVVVALVVVSTHEKWAEGTDPSTEIGQDGGNSIQGIQGEDIIVGLKDGELHLVVDLFPYVPQLVELSAARSGEVLLQTATEQVLAQLPHYGSAERARVSFVSIKDRDEYARKDFATLLRHGWAVFRLEDGQPSLEENELSFDASQFSPQDLERSRGTADHSLSLQAAAKGAQAKGSRQVARPSATLLSIRPFLETVERQRRLLQTIITDPREVKEYERSAAFDLAGCELVWVEVECRSSSERPTQFDINAEWVGADGQPLQAPLCDWFPLPIRDHPRDWRRSVIGAIPAPPSASGLRIALKNIKAGVPVDLRQLKVFGGYVQRRPARQATKQVSERQVDASWEVSFPAEPSVRDLAGQGVSVRAGEIAKVFCIDRRHRVVPVERSTPMVLGKLLPQRVILQTKAGDTITLTPSQCDLVRVAWHPTKDLVTVDLWAYHVAERKFFTFKGGGYHNRAVLDAAPRSRLLLHASCSGSADVPTTLVPLWQPNGSLATLIITEHADLQTVANENVLAFGNPAGKLVKGLGLAGNRIPYTKSVFTHSQEFTYPHGALDQPAFLELIRSYKEHRLPVEIASHSPDDWADAAPKVDESLTRLKEFDARVWIDHGRTSNLEGLGHLGGVKERPQYYILPILRRHGFEYGWSYIDFNCLYREVDGVYDLNMIEEGLASNVLFHNPALDDDPDDDWKLRLFSSVTVQLLERTFFSPAQLRRLVSHRGLAIAHLYFSEVMDFEDGHHIVKVKGQPVRLATWFETRLRNLARAQEKGDLYLATLSEWGAYMEKIGQVAVTPDPTKARSFVLANTSEAPVTAMSFVATSAPEGSWPHLNGERIASCRREGKNLYLSCDVPTGTSRLELLPSR